MMFKSLSLSLITCTLAHMHNTYTRTHRPDTLIAEEDLLKQAYEDYETGAYSPKLLKAIDIEEVMQLVKVVAHTSVIGVEILDFASKVEMTKFDEKI